MIVKRVSIVAGASLAVMFFTHDSMCERRIDRDCMSANVAPAVARSAFSRVDAAQGGDLFEGHQLVVQVGQLATAVATAVAVGTPASADSGRVRASFGRMHCQH